MKFELRVITGATGTPTPCFSSPAWIAMVASRHFCVCFFMVSEDAAGRGEVTRAKLVRTSHFCTVGQTFLSARNAVDLMFVFALVAEKLPEARLPAAKSGCATTASTTQPQCRVAGGLTEFVVPDAQSVLYWTRILPLYTEPIAFGGRMVRSKTMWKFLQRWSRKSSGLLWLPPEIGDQLVGIEPSTSGKIRYYPCLVTLRDGTSLDHICLVEHALYLRHWGVEPTDDAGKQWIRICDVTSVTDSPSRLPAQFANRLYTTGESGMGYNIFTVIFSDGSRQAYITGGLVDFIDYPPLRGPKDVVDVRPHVGRDDNPLPGPAYYWCIYEREPLKIDDRSKPGVTSFPKSAQN